MEIRKAKMSDVEALHKLINSYADAGSMLPRSRNALYESLREFMVIEEAGQIIGCAALHIIWDGLAEIRSLGIAPEFIGQGLGMKLVDTLLDEAKTLEIPKVFALTFKQAFFERCGFRFATKEELPQKVWKECINCPKFPNCDEIAVIKELD